MVRSEVKLGEKICAEDSLADVGDSKSEWEFSLANNEGFMHATITVYLCAIGGAKSEAIGALTALRARRRNYRKKRAAVDEPLVAFVLINDVK